MIIDCISDLHGHYPNLQGGDLLIVAGDFTSSGTMDEFYDPDSGWHGDPDVISWLDMQNYRKIILIAGNHDNFFNKNIEIPLENIEYLQDSYTEFESLKIWGSPWSLWFPGINPHCQAFTGSEVELQKKYDLILKDIDMLITHQPPYGILDLCQDGRHVGHMGLHQMIANHEFPNLKLHVFGHIHECGGLQEYWAEYNIRFVNCSHVDEKYRPVNAVMRYLYTYGEEVKPTWKIVYC